MDPTKYCPGLTRNDQEIVASTIADIHQCAY